MAAAGRIETVARRSACEQIALYDDRNLASRSAGRAVSAPAPNGERLAHGQRRWPAASWPVKQGYAFRFAAAPATDYMPYGRVGAPHLGTG